MKNVKVTYPDGTYSIRSFQSQVKSIHDETLEFQTWFLWKLLYEQISVPTGFGKYSLTNEPTTE